MSILTLDVSREVRWMLRRSSGDGSVKRRRLQGLAKLRRLTEESKFGWMDVVEKAESEGMVLGWTSVLRIISGNQLMTISLYNFFAEP